MIPVLREQYFCTYDPFNAYKPTYKKIKEDFLK